MILCYSGNSKAEETEAALQRDKDVGIVEMAKSITISFFKACLKLVRIFIIPIKCYLLYLFNKIRRFFKMTDNIYIKKIAN